MASCVRVRRRRAARTLAAIGLVAVAAAGLLEAPAWASAPASARASTPTSATVRLVHVTPVVSRPGGAITITLTKSGPGAAAGATVQVTLYSRLTTRSGLLAAIGTPGPSGPVSTTGTLPASCVAAGKALTFGLEVAPSGRVVAHRTLCGRAAPVLRLGCAGSCDGVYPLRVTVRGGGSSTTIDTLVTYATAVSATPLRFAWIVRVAGPASALGGAAGAIAGVAKSPSVPVSLDVQGQTIAAPSSADATVVAALRTASVPRGHELVIEPYVPADLGALRASGLPEEVTRQFALTAQDLRLDGVTAKWAHAVTYGSGPVSTTGVDAVASTGFRHLVVPGTALTTDPASTMSWGEAFRLGGAPSGPTALASDTELSALSDATASDPGLSAADFLGELAFLHYEAPDLPDPRAVVVVTRATSAVGPSFVESVLQGVRHNPVVVPETISNAFHLVPVGANGFLGVRDLAQPTATAYSTATVNWIRFLRLTTDALASAVRGGATPIPSIEGELLSAEQPMPASTRNGTFTSVHNALKHQLGYFRIYDGAITLTQSGASLPITIFSSAPYTYSGFLVLSSPKLSFPGGHVVRLNGPVGSVYSVRVPTNAVVTGDIPLTALLMSPDRRLQMARATITVRATETSVVGIALTVLAVAVLGVWWIRTSRRRRAAR